MHVHHLLLAYLIQVIQLCLHGWQPSVVLIVMVIVQGQLPLSGTHCVGQFSGDCLHLA